MNWTNLWKKWRSYKRKIAIYATAEPSHKESDKKDKGVHKCETSVSNDISPFKTKSNVQNAVDKLFSSWVIKWISYFLKMNIWCLDVYFYICMHVLN